MRLDGSPAPIHAVQYIRFSMVLVQLSSLKQKTANGPLCRSSSAFCCPVDSPNITDAAPQYAPRSWADL
jgi:hypothetical protein